MSLELPIKRFENSFARSLRGDPSGSTAVRQTPEVFYADTLPTPVKDPTLLIWSDEAAKLLDLARPSDPKGWEAQVFSGNQPLAGMQPYAARYGGHQFGNWAGQLGDGRAISLGEMINDAGERWDIQLKGAGPTAYSRRADGRAVLRSSLREFLCSEAMFHLGVPTTRALSCVMTGENVLRDMFYDGHPEWEPGAITTRLAPSFLRFGSFEILAATGETANLKKLVDFTIETHFSAHDFSLDEEGYAAWLHEVARRTATLMVEWMRVGFVHGVMNTDNMSILGLTIDYGPYGWLDIYDPGFTPNTTDAGQKRYRFGQQASIGLWNIARLAESLAPLFGHPEVLEKAFDTYRETFSAGYKMMMMGKLGLSVWAGESDEKLVQDLDAALRAQETDMTLFYRALSGLRATSQIELSDAMRGAFYEPSSGKNAAMEAWLAQYAARTRDDARDGASVAASMNRHNPLFIPRNYLVQEALDGLAAGDRSRLDEVMSALRTPYEDNALTRKFAVKRPEWARQKPGCSDLSCSS